MEEAEVKIQALLASMLHQDEWFPFTFRPLYWIGDWMNLVTGIDVVAKRTNPCLRLELDVMAVKIHVVVI
jgi:hypothetical protein